MATLQDFEERIAVEDAEIQRLSGLSKEAYIRRNELLDRYWHTKANLHKNDKVRLTHSMDGEEYGYEDSWPCKYDTGDIGEIWMLEGIKGFSLEMIDEDGEGIGRITFATEDDVEKVGE